MRTAAPRKGLLVYRAPARHHAHTAHSAFSHISAESAISFSPRPRSPIYTILILMFGTTQVAACRFYPLGGNARQEEPGMSRATMRRAHFSYHISRIRRLAARPVTKDCHFRRQTMLNTTKAQISVTTISARGAFAYARRRPASPQHEPLDIAELLHYAD